MNLSFRVPLMKIIVFAILDFISKITINCQKNIDSRGYVLFLHDNAYKEQHYNPLYDYLRDTMKVVITESDFGEDLKYIVANMTKTQKSQIELMKEKYLIEEIDSDEPIDLDDGMMDNYDDVTSSQSASLSANQRQTNAKEATINDKIEDFIEKPEL